MSPFSPVVSKIHVRKLLNRKRSECLNSTYMWMCSLSVDGQRSNCPHQIDIRRSSPYVSGFNHFGFMSSGNAVIMHLEIALFSFMNSKLSEATDGVIEGDESRSSTKRSRSS